MADRQGVSYCARSRIAVALALDCVRVTAALDRSTDCGSTASRRLPTEECPGERDGVWQLLPLPELSATLRGDLETH